MAVIDTSFVIAIALTVAPQVEVTMRGEDCEGADLSARVAQHLQTSTADTTAKVQAELVREGALWRLQLFGPAPGAERTFRAAACETVIDAAAFVVAVAIDPSVMDRVDERFEPAPPAAAPLPLPPPDADPTPDSIGTSVEPEPIRAPDPAPSPRPRRRSPVTLTLGVDVGIDGGALPRVGALARGHVGVLARYWRVDVLGGYRTPSRALRSDVDGGAWISAWMIGARACGLPPLPVARLDLPLCVGGEGGRIVGNAFDIRSASRGTLPWAAVVAGPALTWAFRPAIALFATAEAGAYVLGGRFTIDNLGPLYVVRVPIARALVGIEGRFSARTGP